MFGKRVDRRKLRRKLTLTKNPFLSLARSIIYQQISTKAGDSIYKKFLKLFGRRKPRASVLLNMEMGDLRKAGLSSQKASYLIDLAKKFEDGTINHKLLYELGDGEVREHLIKVKGIGPWTADMFLIFALNRENILPMGDLGIKKGFQKVFGLKSLPSEGTMMRLARPYNGEYTYFSLYLWQSIDGDTEIST
ncbi:MAG: DNA-3-methyladenine glycosylase family protein [Minisyncoccota bacterium]